MSYSKDIQNALDKIGDDELRAALESLIRTIFRRNKRHARKGNGIHRDDRVNRPSVKEAGQDEVKVCI